MVFTEEGEGDEGDSEYILFKFSIQRVLKWLKHKVKNVESILEKQLKSKRRYEKLVKDEDERNAKENGGAFSSSFNLRSSRSKKSTEIKPENLKPNDSDQVENYTPNDKKEKNYSKPRGSDIILSKEDQKCLSRSSIQMICKYISSSWQEKLIQFLNLEITDVFDSKKSLNKDTTKKKDTTTISSPENTNQPKPSTVTPPSSQSYQQPLSEMDKLIQYTTGGTESTNEKGGDGETGNNKRKFQAAQSLGLKKLQKVNTKGMKSLSSFFGPVSKKKKK